MVTGRSATMWWDGGWTMEHFMEECGRAALPAVGAGGAWEVVLVPEAGRATIRAERAPLGIGEAYLQWDPSETVDQLLEECGRAAVALVGEGGAFEVVMQHDDDLVIVRAERD